MVVHLLKRSNCSKIQDALAILPDDEEQPVGPILSLEDRQLNSLGPLGAGQWTKQYDEKYPHSLLNVRDIDHVLAWQKSLKRTCRQSLRAVEINYTVVAKPITGDEPAPHSSLAVFRCIMEHELRLNLKGKLDENGDDELVDPSVFFGAICEAVERYVISTKMAGTIYEYRLDPAGPIAIIAHEVRKGSVLRGQWCYMTDEAARNYGWFRAAHDLVDRAVQEKDIDVVDLGPNGVDGKLDAHAKLKQRYGFELVENWPAVADYRGPFWLIARASSVRSLATFANTCFCTNALLYSDILLYSKRAPLSFLTKKCNTSTYHLSSSCHPAKRQRQVLASAVQLPKVVSKYCPLIHSRPN